MRDKEALKDGLAQLVIIIFTVGTLGGFAAFLLMFLLKAPVVFLLIIGILAFVFVLIWASLRMDSWEYKDRKRRAKIKRNNEKIYKVHQ